MKGGRLSRPRHCSKGGQPVPKAVYRSGCRDNHNCPRRDSNLGYLTLQSDALTTRPLRPCYPVVRVSVCLSVRDHIFRTTRPIFTNIFVHVTYGRGSVLLWRRNDVLCTSGFTDDVVFADKTKVDRRRRPAEAQCAPSLGLGYKPCAVIPVAGQRTHETTFRALKVTSQVASSGAESAVYCLVGWMCGRCRLGDAVGEFHGQYLLQHDHRLHSALSVRVVHHHAALAVLQT